MEIPFPELQGWEYLHTKPWLHCSILYVHYIFMIKNDNWLAYMVKIFSSGPWTKKYIQTFFKILFKTTFLYLVFIEIQLCMKQSWKPFCTTQGSLILSNLDTEIATNDHSSSFNGRIFFWLWWGEFWHFCTSSNWELVSVLELDSVTEPWNLFSVDIVFQFAFVRCEQTFKLFWLTHTERQQQR